MCSAGRFLITLVWLWFLYPWLVRPVRDSFAGNSAPFFVAKARGGGERERDASVFRSREKGRERESESESESESEREGGREKERIKGKRVRE